MKQFRLPWRKKPKPTSTGRTFPDVMWTSMCALKESADVFPPLKSAVAGVIALWEIAERAKHSKDDAQYIAVRTKEIVDLIAEAVPDGSAISPPMLQSIEHFTAVLDDIRCSMEAIAFTGGFSRALRLNRNEGTLQSIKAKLDDEYRDFSTASALRIEVQQAKLELQQIKIAAEQANVAVQQVKQQKQTQSAIEEVSAVTVSAPRDDEYAHQQYPGRLRTAT
ncbi:hypothetical protein B0H14DRAFT_582980 [Mycena olivaceomarginata]|nr:hypothetical protein B0H14DRAFT_582980 [Mycena olivaceomarginata]